MVRMAAANHVTAGENFRRFCFPERYFRSFAKVLYHSIRFCQAFFENIFIIRPQGLS